MDMILIRLKESGDEPFIYNSWLQSNRAKHPNMPTSDYYAHYKKIVTDILYKSMVIVACDPSSPEFIYGYLVIRPVDDIPILHYAYVKKPFRKFGILKQLLKNQNIDIKEPVLVTIKPPDFLKHWLLVHRPGLKNV